MKTSSINEQIVVNINVTGGTARSPVNSWVKLFIGHLRPSLPWSHKGLLGTFMRAPKENWALILWSGSSGKTFWQVPAQNELQKNTPLPGWHTQTATRVPRTFSIKYGLRTTDYGLGIKHGLRYKTQTEHCRLGTKHEERDKIPPISHQVITVHQGNGILMP